MRQVHLAALTVLSLAACAGAPSGQQAAAPAVFDATSLQKLAAHKVVDLTGVIGAPDTQDPAVEGVVYTWHTSSLDSTWVPTPVMTAGFISSLPKGADSYIRHIDFNGSHIACDPIKSRIADWINRAG